LDSLIRLKRIYAKHLQTNILKHLLLSVAEIQSTYAHDINRSAVQLESMKEFLDGFLAHLKSEQFTLEEAIDYMVFEQFP
jgi:CRISPR/Cas system CSM-associated protein Csm2 small subunit